MESQIATGADAHVIMKLYELRTEAVLRKARQWVVFEFSPKNIEEFFAVQAAYTSEQSSWLRQVISYWEMAASFVLHGAVNSDMFLDSNGEGIFIYAKFHEFAEGIQAKSGLRFMRHTAELIDKNPNARERFQRAVKTLEARK